MAMNKIKSQKEKQGGGVIMVMTGTVTLMEVGIKSLYGNTSLETL